MIEKDKTYTYDELKYIIAKASALVLSGVEKDIKGAGIEDIGFAMQMNLTYLMSFGQLNKVLFKDDKEKEN